MEGIKKKIRMVPVLTQCYSLMTLCVINFFYTFLLTILLRKTLAQDITQEGHTPTHREMPTPASALLLPLFIYFINYIIFKYNILDLYIYVYTL